MLLSLSALLLLSWMQAGVEPTESPTPLVTPGPVAQMLHGMVTVPVSWRSENWSVHDSDPHLRRLAAWATGDGDQSIAVDVADVFGVKLRSFAQSIADGMHKSNPQFALREAGTVRLCRGQDGWKQMYAASSGGGITYVFAVTALHLYVATYSFGQSSPEGEAAAESLCPPPDPVVHVPPPPLQAPARWTAVPEIADRSFPVGVTAWAWIAPQAEYSQRLVALKFPLPAGHGGLSYGFSAMLAHLAKGHATVLRRSPVELCHSTDAVFVAMEYSAGTQPMLAESVMTIAGTNVYAAVYTRSASQRPRSEAELALKSLCPPSK